MDHWGDPWADDTNTDSQAPAKEEVKTPQNTAFGAAPTAPVLLNGFLDDAQWGSVEPEEDFGGWTSSTNDAADSRSETRVRDAEPTSIPQTLPETATYSGYGEQSGFNLQDEGWGDLEGQQPTVREAENVVSEASDSATTIQPEDTPERISTDLSDALHPDDDFSTRPSTSPSDASHTEVTTESPRTSFEDERIAGKSVATTTERGTKQGAGAEGSVTESKRVVNESSDGDDFGDFEDDHQVSNDTYTSNEFAGLAATEISKKEQDEVHLVPGRENETEASVPTPSAPIAGLGVDPTLLTQLFPPSKSLDSLPQAPDDPVYSTSARKAWYRLTRKQTMREFNTGGDENNYVRVNWQNSRIRMDVNKIVSRWAGEDRLAGRGPGGRASFFWDRPHPDNKAPSSHVRKQSSIPASSSMRPAKQNIQPLATNVPASFDWSSPSVAHDPWKQDSSSIRAVSSPLAAKPVAVSRVQRQENRSVSVDLTRRDKPLASHHKTASLISPIANVTSILSPTSHASKPSMDANENLWDNVSSSDTAPQSQPTSLETATEDDDDWGEMVVSPAISSPAASEAFSPSPQPLQSTPTPSTTPRKSAKSSPFQPPPSKHASPIVRLKSTVSPTSALFGINSFVPTNVEEGPIGPSILKPANKPTPEKPRAEERSTSTTTDEAPTTMTSDDVSSFDSFTSQPAPEPKEIDDFSSFEPSMPNFEPSAPPPPSEPTVDPWSSADFSIFESATAAPSQASQPTQFLQTDPTDPFSIFDAPASTPFSRPAPRPKTPPTQQPLTGATNSAQKRKAEEDEIIRSIISDLPDLTYMLRR